MPDTAPAKVNRRQKRLRRMTGPKAAPKTPQAFSTSAMMVPELGLEAISSATTAMTTTMIRPAQSISLSVAFLRKTGL